jgi:hypothetical protein
MFFGLPQSWGAPHRIENEKMQRRDPNSFSYYHLLRSPNFAPYFSLLAHFLIFPAT